jgi:hypothetical protein
MRLLTATACAWVLLLAACANLNDDFTSTNIMQRTVRPDTAETLTLQAGDSLTIPAGTFNRETVVMFADVFTGGDASSAYFPTAGKDPEDLLAAVVINTPVDRTFAHNLPLTFDIIQPGESRIPSAIVPGGTYTVYRFDFDTATWAPYGDTVAVVNAGGTSATTTLPTAGFTGFIGSLAIFDGLLAE